MDLGQRAEELEAQRGEDMQRSGEYQEIVVAVEELFHQVSREWDYLARYQAFLWRHTVCSFLIGCIYLLTLNTCIIYCIHTLSCVTIITLSQQKQLLFVLLYCNDQMSYNPCLCVLRADTESTSEHLEALRKLSSDLEEQRATLEDLRDQRQAILPRLSLLDKELVKQQVELHSLQLLLKMVGNLK